MKLLEEQLGRMQFELDCAYKSNADLQATLAESVPERRLDEVQALVKQLREEKLQLENNVGTSKRDCSELCFSHSC